MNKQTLIDDYKQTIERLQKECTEKTDFNIKLMERIKELEQKLKELEGEIQKQKQYFDLFKENEYMLASALQLIWGKQIAEEQEDCKNIDYRKPITTDIYRKISEFQETLKDVAFAQSVNMGKTKPLGDTGSPKSYKRWEKRQRELISKAIKWF